MDSQVKKNGLKELWDSSALAGENASYLDQLYESYLRIKKALAKNGDITLMVYYKILSIRILPRQMNHMRK